MAERKAKRREDFFGRFISIRRCLAVLAYSYGDEDQTNDNQTFNRSHVQLWPQLMTPTPMVEDCFVAFEDVQSAMFFSRVRDSSDQTRDRDIEAWFTGLLCTCA